MYIEFYDCVDVMQGMDIFRSIPNHLITYISAAI
jgi:hypothetical protein